ncbi:tonB-system energizer ExbB [Pseudaminobacter sp. NGMCC 1.201702]|uniref:tonB-system energizer ExbB n=1 Tax=Pseudaminobacter sp. NGMCC 1.201702 TaxID=3391825 RepID=UPI0039EEA7E1
MRPVLRFGFCVALFAAAMVPAGGASAQAPLSDTAAPTTQAAPANAANDPAPPAPVQPAPLQPQATQQVPAGAEAQAAAEPAATPLTLPRDLSPWGMFMAADIVVKAVMVGLAFASLVTWTVWLAKSIEISGAGLRARRAVKAIAQARSLSEAGSSLDGRGDPATYLVRAAAEEVALSNPALDHVSGDGLKERVTSRLARIEAAAVRRLSRGTGVLATIGSTAPFVGLFGTVWGIMNAFIGISEAETTNLAVVAPGIAEALLATALGLVAAIPAVVIYNVFARSTAGYRQLLADASAGVERLVSRDLDFRTIGSRQPKQMAAE